MRRTALLIGTGLVVVTTAAVSQVPPPPAAALLPPAATPPPENPSPRFGPTGALPPDPVAPSPSVPYSVPVGLSPNLQPPAAVPPRLAEPTVEQMIEALERLKAQRAELDRQEQAVKEALAKKLAAQGERLKKLGVGERKDEPKPAARGSVGGIDPPTADDPPTEPRGRR